MLWRITSALALTLFYASGFALGRGLEWIALGLLIIAIAWGLFTKALLNRS